MTPRIEELMKMRDLTRMTGTVTNVQMHQLKMWPLVILSAEKATVSVDTEAASVEFDVEGVDWKSLPAVQTPQEVLELFRARMQHLDGAVKLLFGEEYSVVIKMKGKLIQSFPPKSPVGTAHEPKFETPEDAVAFAEATAWTKKR
ncbi:hypothetical protein [Myxococcus phage Mx1]|nr:hypothetical protein [Myxococcus phage Mx1]